MKLEQRNLVPMKKIGTLCQRGEFLDHSVTRDGNFANMGNISLRHISGISPIYLKQISGKSQVNLRHISGKSQTYLSHISGII